MSEPNSKATTGKTFNCPDCKKPMRRIEGKMGPFWGCSDFPRCKATMNDVDGKPSVEVDEHYRCPICTRKLVRAAREKGDYWFCSGFTKGCKVTLLDANGVPQTAYRCKSCGNLLVKRAHKSTGTEFWGCSEFPVCRTTYPDKDNKPDFDILISKHS